MEVGALIVAGWPTLRASASELRFHRPNPDDAEHHDIRRTICLFALVTPKLTGMALLPNGAGLWGKAGGFAIQDLGPEDQSRGQDVALIIGFRRVN